MNRSSRLLVATMCLLLFGSTSLSTTSLQTLRKPAETVRRFYEMMSRGETEGIEKLFLLPIGTTEADINEFRVALADVARDLNRRGGIRSLTILVQEVMGEHAEVKFRYALADGTTAEDKLDLIYHDNQWSITSGKSMQVANEIAAITSVQDIAKAQILYSVTKGRGNFTDLATLGKQGLIDSKLASGEKQGYLFASKPILADNQSAMFDTTAKPKSTGILGTGSRSYYSNETVVVYEAEGREPPTAIISNRVPKNGSPIK